MWRLSALFWTASGYPLFFWGIAMRSPYRFAVLSYSLEIETLLHEFMNSDEYSLDYVPLQYQKMGMGTLELLKNGYDICLVYSSFAPSLMNDVGKGIIDINKSDMDRARALLRARELSTRIGISIQKQERVDCEFLEQICGVKLYKIPYDVPRELREGMLRAMKKGVSVFIGGGMVTAACQACGTRGFPILPNRDSIADAIERAKNFARLAREEKVKHDQLMAIFKLFKDGVLHIDNKKECTYFNLNALNLLNINEFRGVVGEAPEEMRRKIRQCYDALFINDVLQNGVPHIDQLVSIYGRELVVTPCR
jgi:PAS domain-containing protein